MQSAKRRSAEGAADRTIRGQGRYKGRATPPPVTDQQCLTGERTMSWSMRGRYVPGCGPSHRTESNCLRFALSWYRQIRTTLGSAGLSADSVSPQVSRRAA
jgi:hypothetical protein